jgi:hypothetical protein
MFAFKDYILYLFKILYISIPYIGILKHQHENRTAKTPSLREADAKAQRLVREGCQGREKRERCNMAVY